MWRIIVAPLLGGLIGYITNDLAIRMLFHPYKAVYIGKLHVPFTPGLIPAQQPRIATAIGAAVSEHLLDAETLSKELLSETTLNRLHEIVLGWLERTASEQRNARMLLQTRFADEQIEGFRQSIHEKVTVLLQERIKDAKLGSIVAEQAAVSIREKLGGLGALIIPTVTAAISGAVDGLIESKGDNIVDVFVGRMESELLNTSICKLTETQKDRIPELADKIVSAYKQIVIENMERVLRMAKIDKIIAKRVAAFDAAELEKLIFGLMKRELNAIVYLGAALGFLMGFVNLLF